MPPGWKRISHVERMAAAAPSAPRRREKPPLAVVPPDLERPAVMVQVTRASAEAAGLGAQSMYLTVPAYAAYSTPATRERERGRENSHSTATDSESQSRATVLSRFGWAVPITPMFNLVMSRRSSAGSSRFVSPGGPLETPRMGVKFPRAEPDQQSDKSKQGSEVTRLTGFEYDREAVHSLSDFQWAEIATPQRSPAPSQTMHSFLSDMQSDRSANVLDRLDRLPEIPGEEIGSGEETETEKTPTKRRGKAKAAVSKP
ncbi:hypothetical protein BKA62DRAFT_302151 [Auriculariales sp. MPI-PUGE-AT-0066]|nr:hypothetical protein BKA62DRAFT_302151 [Auriculariales sp. MPI-PUGE-AT-0066]